MSKIKKHCVGLDEETVNLLIKFSRKRTGERNLSLAIRLLVREVLKQVKKESL